MNNLCDIIKILGVFFFFGGDAKRNELLEDSGIN